MNSDVEKFIKGESKNSYNYFGAHKVSEGACFRIYAPHAKEIEVVVNDKNYRMDKVDFRGIFETRVKEIREFDSYYYEVLTNDNVWVNKNDPYTFYNENNKSVFVEKDEYIFNDEIWFNKEKDSSYFNACLLKDGFKMDEQRDFIKYLKEYNYNYLILRPYNEKYFYSINEMFVNDSSLKTFIDNLHQVGIGVLFDIDTSYFYDYELGLNDLDGEGVYNKKEDKYKDIDVIYFDTNKNHTKSYLTSFVNYYLNGFHGDGLYLDDSEFNKELVNELEDKLIIYKGKENKQGYASSEYLDTIVNNVNGEFDHKAFANNKMCLESYYLYDYEKYFNCIKGNEEKKKDIAKVLLSITYVGGVNVISTYNVDEEYLKCLKILTDLKKNSKALLVNSKRNMLLNGKKNKYFAYEFISRNDYVLMVLNFSSFEDDKFDLGMSSYGYYKLLLNNKINYDEEELFVTRAKKVHNKDIALQMKLESNQVLVFKRMKGI